MHVRILKMSATSGFLTALECTKFDFRRASAPDPAGGACTASSDPLAGLKGLRGGKKTGREGGEEVGEAQKTGENGREGVEKGEREEGGGKKSKNTPSVNSCLRPWLVVVCAFS